MSAVALPVARSRYARPEPVTQPIWPALSLAFLVTVSVIVHPLLVSILNITLLLVAAVAWVAQNGRLEWPLLRVVLPFVAIIAIGMVGGTTADTYLFFKDAWYFMNPPILITVGYVLYRNAPDVTLGLRAFVLAGTLLAIGHLALFASRIDLLSELSATQIRSVMGQGLYAPVLAAAILLAYTGRWQQGLRMPAWLSACCMLVCVVSMSLTFSRTILLVALIALAAAVGLFARRELLRLAIIVPCVVALLLTAQTLVHLDPAAARTSFVGKLLRSLEENTISDQPSLQDVHDNWRGYETSRALDTYASGEPHELLLGRGFGTLVDIGLFIDLGRADEGKLRLIPILHNGYMYLLVKGGPAALILFLWVIGSIYMSARQAAADPGRANEQPLHRTLQAAVISLAASTWFLSGAFTRFDMIPYLLVIGYLIAASAHGSDRLASLGPRALPPQRLAVSHNR